MNLAIQADLTMIDAFNRLIKPLEGQIEKLACQHDPNHLYRLKTVSSQAFISLHDANVKGISLINLQGIVSDLDLPISKNG